MSTNITASFQGKAGRTAVVAVATSGLVLGVSAAATAEPAAKDVIQAPSLKSTSLTVRDLERAGTQAKVVVDAGTDLGFAAATVSAEAPPPPPPPPPVVRTVTSRTRTAPAVADADANQNNSNDTATETESAEPAETTEEAPQAAPPIDGSVAEQVLAIARQYKGVPYVTGGASPSGFDCSGFTQYVFAQVGISLPRTSSAQSGVGYRVSAADARPGDLIWKPGHIGIYTGNGQHIAARNPGKALTEGPTYMDNPVYIRVIG